MRGEKVENRCNQERRCAAAAIVRRFLPESSLLRIGSDIYLCMRVLNLDFMISKLSFGTDTSLRRLKIIALSIILRDRSDTLF